MTEQELLEQIRALIATYHVAAPDLTPLARIVKLGERIAQRHLSGQAGEGMDKDAQALIDQMGDLPFELRGLL